MCLCVLTWSERLWWGTVWRTAVVVAVDSNQIAGYNRVWCQKILRTVAWARTSGRRVVIWNSAPVRRSSAAGSRRQGHRDVAHWDGMVEGTVHRFQGTVEGTVHRSQGTVEDTDRRFLGKVEGMACHLEVDPERVVCQCQSNRRRVGGWADQK